MPLILPTHEKSPFEQGEAAAKLFDDLRERLKSDLMHDIGITEQDIAETMPPKP